MAILIGIDEAGYGPTLGPLVVCSTVFELPDSMIEGSIWEILSRQVTRRRLKRGSKLHVNDSKQVFNRDLGIGTLERPVLTMLNTWTDLPDSLDMFLNQLSAACRKEMCDYPWYAGQSPKLPQAIDVDAIKVKSNSLRLEMRSAKVALRQIRAEPLLEGRYNNMVQATENKSRVLFTQISRLIGEAFDKYHTQNLHIFIDKQGGRDHYTGLLQLMFPEMSMKIVAESAQSSRYYLSRGTAGMTLTFMAEAERQQFPVALASMVCKYLRELFMGCFNRFWQVQLPELQATAGYYTDAQRFLKDIAPVINRMNINRQQMVRVR